MLKEPTTTKLAHLRLNGMLDAWEQQQKTADVNQLSFDERFALLVDAEDLYRENRRLTQYLKEARLRISSACMEDIECSVGRNLDRARVRQLGTVAGSKSSRT